MELKFALTVVLSILFLNKAPLVLDAADLDNARYAVGTDEDALIIEVPNCPATSVSEKPRKGFRSDSIRKFLATNESKDPHNTAPCHENTLPVMRKKWKFFRGFENVWFSLVGPSDSKSKRDSKGANFGIFDRNDNDCDHKLL